MKNHPNNYEELGYKRYVESVYWEALDITTIYERVYDTSKSPKKLIASFHVGAYKGKPDLEKTKETYKTIKTILWEESIDGVRYVKWRPPSKTQEEIEKEEEERKREEEIRELSEEIEKSLEEWNKSLTEEEREKILIRRLAQEKLENMKKRWIAEGKSPIVVKIEGREEEETEEDDDEMDWELWHKMKEEDEADQEAQEETKEQDLSYWWLPPQSRERRKRSLERRERMRKENGENV